jgi:hypothetical protein
VCECVCVRERERERERERARAAGRAGSTKTSLSRYVTTQGENIAKSEGFPVTLSVGTPLCPYGNPYGMSLRAGSTKTSLSRYVTESGGQGSLLQKS